MTIPAQPRHALNNIVPGAGTPGAVWHELGRRFPPAAGKSILIFGAGKYTRRLLRIALAVPAGPLVTAIVDDQAIPGQTLAGLPVLRPDTVSKSAFNAVFLGTDHFETEFAARCLTLYGSSCEILRYSELVNATKLSLTSDTPYQPMAGDPLLDLTSIWDLARCFTNEGHECNDFKDNLLLAIAVNTKASNMERPTEYGFAELHIGPPLGQKKLLDIGSVGSAFPLRMAGNGFEVTCLDPTATPGLVDGVRILRGDIRNTTLPESSIDLITCISTLEHIGLAGRYGIQTADPEGETLAMREMARLLRPGGRLILTVPFGQYAMLPLNRVYTRDRIMELKGNLECRVENYYCITPDGQFKAATGQEASTADLRKDGYYALGCFVFQKTA
jgi:SAM-dependent methyltransferase